MRSSRLTAVTLATSALLAVGVGSAAAHVTATPTTTAAGASTLVTFALAHGCEGSPTTGITITLPQELTTATPTVNPNWTISSTQETLSTPRTLANGSQVSERTASITYTAKAPLADHQRDTFTLSLQLPDAAGQDLIFPTLQTCETGQTDWSEVPAAGADHHSVQSPAPAFAITAALADAGHGDTVAGGHGDTAAAGHGDTVAGTDTGADSAGHGEVVTGTSVGLADAAWPGWVGLIAGVAGLLLGAAAFWRSGRTRPTA